MGIKTDIQLDLVNAYADDLADALKTFTYNAVERVFDPATNTTTEVTTEYETRGIILNYKERNLDDSNILPTTIKIIILQNELNTMPVVDATINNDSVVYTIKDVLQDPVSAIWTLKCQK